MNESVGQIATSNVENHAINNNYTSTKWPRSRNVVLDAAYFASKRHLVHSLLEVDVTEVRRHIKTLKKAASEQDKEYRKNPVSFTAFIIKCVAQAVQQHPLVHSYRTFWGTKLISFQSVDISTMIETEKDEVAVPEVFRDVNAKTVQEITDEIRAVQNHPNEAKFAIRFWLMMPSFIRRLFFWIILCRPKWIKQMMGTIAVSSMGMFGKEALKSGGSSYAIGYVPFHTSCIFIGGIASKACLKEDKNGAKVITEREFLSITITFDHDIVDGAPAARFSSTIKSTIESGANLIPIP